MQEMNFFAFKDAEKESTDNKVKNICDEFAD